MRQDRHTPLGPSVLLRGPVLSWHRGSVLQGRLQVSLSAIPKFSPCTPVCHSIHVTPCGPHTSEAWVSSAHFPDQETESQSCPRAGGSNAACQGRGFLTFPA